MNAIAQAGLLIDEVDQGKAFRSAAGKRAIERPAWRPPLPNLYVPLPTTKSRAATARTAALQEGIEVTFERLLLVLLAVAAIIGIAYGFCSLLDLVQNWAVFEGGTAKFL